MSRKKLEIMFNRYAQNWSEVKRHPKLHVKPNLDDVFLCPMCFDKFFTRQDLEAKTISLEHVPPQRYGGHVRTLTCTACNNRAGSELESPLGRQLETLAFFGGTLGSSQEVVYNLNGVGDLAAVLHQPNSGTFLLEGDPKRSNPRYLQAVDEMLKKAHNAEDLKFKVTFKLPNSSQSNAALLRIAYLWAFSVFGYGFLINPCLRVVRGQINNPTKPILPTWGIIRQNFPDKALGVNLITAPKELRSFLVVFDITSPGSKVTTRYGVILPGPSAPGLNIYGWLKEHVSKELSIRMTPIPQDVDIITYPFASHDIWNDTRLS